MLLQKLRLADEFISSISAQMYVFGGRKLTKKQRTFIGFCISAMVLMGGLNFAAFASASLGLFSEGALSWMLHKSKIEWSI